MDQNLKKKIITGLAIFVAVVLLISAWQIYVPRDFGASETIFYSAKAGLGGTKIAQDLKDEKIIKSSFWFNAYALLTGQSARLQAGLYDISPSMSIAALVKKMATGDVAKHKIKILEGWDVTDMADYLEEKKFYTREEFNKALKMDFSKEFDFLYSKPKGMGLEGYIFPDTYYVPVESSAKDFLTLALNNFGKKLTPELRKKITADKRSIYQVVTMASILEKEVPTLIDKKMVAGILWKRIVTGMPLQLDSTVNYATGKSDSRVTLADSKIDSRYNTYKYYGLPLGPISNPGLESLMAAINPIKTEYWFYLSASGNGKTIFSKTYEEHTSSISKYLNS